MLQRLLLLGLALGLAACGTLRDVADPDDPQWDKAGPTVTGAHGALSPRAAHSLLLRHWKNSFADTQALAATEELATSQPLIAGNQVTLLYDGPQTVAAMTRAIAAAHNHINLETYIFDADAVGTAMADLLIERQRAGVQVHIIYDAVGTLGTPQAFFERMRAAGIQLLAFNPVNPLKVLLPWELNQRDHRKLLVVDGRVAFTGGVNISSSYANSSLFRAHTHSHGTVGWRDTHVQIEGPAVAALQWEFLNHWANQQGPALGDSDFFPAPQVAGTTLLRVLASEPEGAQEIYRAYLLAIRSAKKSVHITAAYFAPDPLVLRALQEAAQRGVEVTLVLPAVRESSLVFYAGHALYSELLQSGIHLYQLQVTVLHAKTAVVDGVWSTVGSANMDTRSFLHNHELNVVVFDPAFGQAMESAFAEDLRLSTPMTLAQWEQRPLSERLKEWLSSRFAYWL
ncbi:MAG: cardiolipin synthase [Rhodoferax sp.]|nr:cardiolipin synthase [Rhodoferax sp.]